MRLPVLLGCGLLAACNFPADDHQTVGSKGLWVANGTNVVEYNPAQLGGGTSATPPHVAISSEVMGSPQGVAFDPMGNLWVVDSAANVTGAATPALYEFTAAQLATLATDNSPEPVAIITSPFLLGPHQIVIDALGNAWIADPKANAVLTYTATQLGQTGTQKVGPVLVITSDQFANPAGIGFDAAGNLWIANSGTAAAVGTTVVEITKAKIPAIPEMGTFTPKVVVNVSIANAATTIQAPSGVAFDSSDTLWWSNGAASTAVGFPGASQATSTSVPTTTLSSAQVNSIATIDQPGGICIDDAGNLAVVSSAGAFGVAMFGASQVTSTGAPTPSTFIGGAATMLNAPQGCTFGPTVK